MSIFNELLHKINEISNGFSDSLKNDLQSALDSLDKFGEEYMNGKSKGREKNKNALTTLQSIHEDEDEPPKVQETQAQTNKRRSSNKPSDTHTDINKNKTEVVEPKRRSKKRSKDEVDEMSSPEQDKRPKRNASVRAQGVISKQVNVNLLTKMRRGEECKSVRESRSSRRKGKQDDTSDKENAEPVLIKVKQEKISLPPEETMDCETLPVDIEVKVEPNKDDIAMPPPVAPVPKPRGRQPKNKDKELNKTDDVDEESGRKRTTRNRKDTDTDTVPPPAPRATRASNRASNRTATTDDTRQETRPKRTRAKKKVSDTNMDAEKETTQEIATVTPEKPRPKRTRRGQKAAEKEAQKQIEQSQQITKTASQETISPKEERISEPIHSPILNKKSNKDIKKDKSTEDSTTDYSVQTVSSDETRIVNMNVTVDICSGDNADKTVILPNGKINRVPTTPTKKGKMNETMVIESSSCNRDTVVLEKVPPAMDATVVLDKAGPKISSDNSLVTDDESDPGSCESPPVPQPSQPPQPTSAVKVKVQQFEEMASRVTRTKTRAMAKKEDTEETHTPPDKIGKPVLSVETLNKMNSLIFNGKTQISSSASKPRANVVTSVKSLVPSSTSKLCSMTKHKELADETMKREKEDARKKKEAMLEAKKEAQKRKREDKMSAAAAARSAAERARVAALAAAARDRAERQATVDRAIEEKQREAERKKQEQARKAAEMEERRRVEEKARLQRLADEQKRADAARRRHDEDQEAVKKEAAQMQKEIEKRQKEYIEKLKLKQKIEADRMHTPVKVTAAPYTADGFDQLNSDEDEDETPQRHPVPAWSSSKVRWHQLTIQSHLSRCHVDRLFSTRVHSPDLREIFPNIERRALVRTSSAVWRTPT